jgi:hypothetical protein
MNEWKNYANVYKILALLFVFNVIILTFNSQCA